MPIETVEISVQGRKVNVPGMSVQDSLVVIKGRFLRIARVFDEYWLEKKSLPDPLKVIETLQNFNHRPDIFTFSQRVPDANPKYDFHVEWDNYAVIHLDSFENWFNKQISSAARRNIRKVKSKVFQ